MNSLRIAVVGLLLSWTAQAQEADVDDLAGLLDSNVVSGASRSAERADDAPATITTVTADDLRRYGVRTVAEAMNFLSVGMMSQDPNHSVEVGSRGVLLTADYGNHMIVIIDGHLMNEAWNGTAYTEQGLGLPLEAIDHIELMAGPGSVLYGSYAMLGVINIVTKRAKDLGRVQLNVEGAVMPPQGLNGEIQFRPGFGGSVRVSGLTGHEFTLGGKPLELSLGLEHYQHQGQSFEFPVLSGFTTADGAPMNWGPRAPAPGSWGGRTTDAWWTQVSSGLLKVRWGDWNLMARAVRSVRSSPAMGTFGPISADFDRLAEESDHHANFELRWSHQLGERVGLMARGYFDLYRYDSRARLGSWSTFGSGLDLGPDVDTNAFEFAATYPADVQWGGAEVQANIDWLGDGRFPLLMGVDGRVRNYSSASVYYDAAGALLDTAGAYGVTEWMVAPYVQQRARILPSLQANVGLRLDAQSSFAPRPSPRAALVWTTPWEGRVKAVFSSAFRTPSGYERFTEYPGYQLKNPALRPETVLTGEVGYEQRFGRHKVLLGAFVSKYDDMVQLLPAPADVALSGEYWLQNAGSILNVGGSGQVEGAFGDLRYSVSFTAAHNITESPLNVAPPWFGNARLSYDFGEHRPRLSLASFFTAARRIDVAGNTGVDADGSEVAWTQETVAPQVDLRLTVDSAIPVVPGLSARLVVGTSLTPFSPYVAGPLQAPDPAISATPVLNQNTRLFLMGTVSWNLDVL